MPAHKRHFFVLGLLVVALAFWLRFDQLASLPFSWHIDEAAHGLEARDVLGGYWPVFFAQFTGHEALYIYAIAGAFALFGDSIFAARLVGAWAGVLTVALTVPLGRLLWPGARGRAVGVWAALLLGVSLWHLIGSHNAYRVILQPLLQAAALVAGLWAARRTQTGARPWAAWALAGLFTGLALHTYLAARAFPVVMLALGGLWLWQATPKRPTLAGLMLAGAVAAAVFAPLGWYFYTNPTLLTERTAQVSLLNQADPLAALLNNLRDTAQMVMTAGAGDPSHKHNIAGWPVFDPVIGALFWLGVALTAWQVRQRATRLASFTVFITVLVMLLPMVLSAQGIPHYLRAMGVLPVWMLWPALAGVVLWQAALQHTPPHWRTRAWWLWPPLMLALALNAHATFFNQWVNVPANPIERLTQIHTWYNAVRPTWRGEPLYLATGYPENVSLAYLSPAMYEATHDFDARQAVALPPQGQPGPVYATLEEQPNPDLLTRAGLTLVREGRGPQDTPAFQEYAFSGVWPTPAYTAPIGWSWEINFAPTFAATPITAPVNVADRLSLLGYDLSATALTPGEVLAVTLFWQLHGPAEREYSMFAQLLSANSQVVAQFDANRYPATRWGADQMLMSHFPLGLPPDLPAGTYQLQVGVYHQPTGERLMVMQAGEPVADRLLLHPINVR